jgi:dCMP deaminase
MLHLTGGFVSYNFQYISRPELSVVDKWDLDFLRLAKFWANLKSKDPSSKVGAVIADGRSIVSLGFNGLPQCVQDTEERLNNREIKYKMVVHAEVNAILFAKAGCRDCSLYTYPFMPCSSCAGIVINSGITRVVTLKNDNPRWIESFGLTRQMFGEANVDLIEVVPVEIV